MFLIFYSFTTEKRSRRKNNKIKDEIKEAVTLTSEYVIRMLWFIVYNSMECDSKFTYTLCFISCTTYCATPTTKIIFKIYEEY